MTSEQAILSFKELVPPARLALGRFVLAGVLPVLTFYVLLRRIGPHAGIAGGMAVSVIALGVQFARMKRLDPVVLVPLFVIIFQGSAALLLNSVDVYLAAPALENFLWGVALVGSALMRRPLISVIARELGFIPSFRTMPSSVSLALGRVTLAWGLAAFVKAIVRLWLLMVLPLELFLVTITLLSFGLNVVLVAFSFWLPLRVARVAASVVD